MRAQTSRALFFFILVVAGAALLPVVMASPPRAGSSDEPAAPVWTPRIRAMDEALARGDIPAATRARVDAYRGARGSGRWEGMAAVGDASLRLGKVVGNRGAMAPEARSAYLAALFRARAGFAGRRPPRDGGLRRTG